MEGKAWRGTSVALFATFCAAAVIALGVSAIFAPTALAAGSDVAEEAGMVREVASVDEGATASAEEVAAIGDEPKADTADQEIYAIFYDNPDKKSYTLVIQNGDTLDPAYPKPADDQVILVCEGDGGSCNCQSLNDYGNTYNTYVGYTTHAKVGPGVTPHATNSWFNDFTSLESLDLSGLNTSKVGSMHSMFGGCSSLESLDLSKFDTAAVTEMSCMFQNCSSLKTLVFPEGIDTSKVTSMCRMFEGCSSLTALPFLSGFNTSKVSEMFMMFEGCSSLESLDLAAFDTSKVVEMRAMFSDCSSLRDLSFSDKFTTSWVTNMRSMFSGCASLKSLDLSKFDMGRVKEINYMLIGCDSLSKVSLPVTGDFAKAGLSSWRDGKPVKWRNEKGEVFAANAIPSRTAGTYTAVVEGDSDDNGSGGNNSGSGNGDGDNSGSGNGNGSGDNGGSGNGNGGSSNGSGTANPAPKRTVAFSEAVALPLDATGVAMDKDDIIRDLAKRFGSREGFPTDASSVAVTIMLGGKEVEAIDPTRAGTYEVTAVYSMPDGTERVIEAAYTVADPAAKAPVKAAARSATRLAQTGDEATPAVPLATAALAACALAAAVAVRRRARG